MLMSYDYIYKYGDNVNVILKIKAQDTEELQKELCPCGKDKKVMEIK